MSKYSTIHRPFNIAKGIPLTLVIRLAANADQKKNLVGPQI